MKRHIFILLFLFVILSISTSLYIFSSFDSHTSEYFSPDVYIVKPISLGEYTVHLVGYKIGLNSTWLAIDGTKKSFPAMWSTKIDGFCRLDSILPIKKQVLYNLQKSGLYLIFTSDYNGTSFNEAIILGDAKLTLDGSYKLIDESNRTYTGYGYYQITSELNRTEVNGNTINSPYNPFGILRSAVEFLVENISAKDIYVMNVYLIPRKYLIDDFSSYAFIWSFVILYPNESKTNAQNNLMAFHFIFSSNSTMLSARQFILSN